VDHNDEIKDARSESPEPGATEPAAPTPWWSRKDASTTPSDDSAFDTRASDTPPSDAPAPGTPASDVPAFEGAPVEPISADPDAAAAADRPSFSQPSSWTTPLSDVAAADVIETHDPAPRRRGIRQGVALTAAAVVLSAAAAGTVVHVVDDHSGTTVAATAATSSTSSNPASTLPQAASSTSDVKTALAKIEPSVVLINDTITGTASGRGGFGGFGGFQESGAGTGIIISADGQVVTNAHVVNGATDIKVTLPNNGGTHSATIVGIDTTQDLAVIQISGVSGLKPATFANSDSAQVGDSVLAVGNALGYGGAPTVTEGILSAKGRSLTGTTDSLTNLLQTDAAINPGNSGGPLVDATGQVIGINVAVASGTSTEPAQNIGFAIPANTVVNDLTSLKAGKGAGTQTAPATQAATFLGVSVSDASSGALVEAVQPGSPAETAGIQVGDVITAANGKSIADGAALQQLIRSEKAGAKLTLTISRNGSPTTVTATLGTTQVTS
jgi:S1-C subfamily serine protease